jgi:hypothetical protein
MSRENIDTKLKKNSLKTSGYNVRKNNMYLRKNWLKVIPIYTHGKIWISMLKKTA